MFRPRTFVVVVALLVAPWTVAFAEHQLEPVDDAVPAPWAFPGLLPAITQGLLLPNATAAGPAMSAHSLATTTISGFPDGIWDLTPLPSSVPRHSHSLIYDPLRDRLIAF